MRSEPRERSAVYPAFALRATRGSSSLEDQTSSFSTNFMALRNLELHARNDDDATSFNSDYEALQQHSSLSRTNELTGRLCGVDDVSKLC